jgi:hypothetical protein
LRRAGAGGKVRWCSTVSGRFAWTALLAIRGTVEWELGKNEDPLSIPGRKFATESLLIHAARRNIMRVPDRTFDPQVDCE